jgi:formylglycine-generating enzyme required for sulfatase activity
MDAKGQAQGGDSAHRFYISSPFLGLKKEREEAKKLITRRNHAYGDSYGGSPDPLVETCQRDVRASDHYVLILGERYGTRKPEHGGKSVTELEFEAALDAGLSLHAYFLGYCWDTRNGIERDPEALAALKAFQRRVSDHCVPVDCSDQEDGRSGWQVFSEAITALAANPPLKPGERALGAASARRSYTPQELQTWVERHHPKLERAFLGLPSVQARQVHVPLDVCLNLAGAAPTEGPRLLTPEDLAPLLEESGDHVLLLSGDGGAGKTSLAFAIARWWLEGEPGGVVRLPVLIEAALAPGETVVERVRSWLRGQLRGATEADLAKELVVALLAAKRLIPIIDHLSEMTSGSKEQLLAALPSGLVVVTSRSVDDGFRERPLSRIVPQPIALDRLQSFFMDYLNQGERGQLLKDDELVPAQSQLRRIVGDKPITPLLAQMFIDDVIANRQKGLLAGSVPQLMLSYVKRLHAQVNPDQQKRAGLTVDRDLVQQALKRLALAGHQQDGVDGKPAYQPREFSLNLAINTLQLPHPQGIAKQATEAEALLGYLRDIQLLVNPGEDTSEFRFPLDPLADYMAALSQLDLLETLSRSVGQTAAWEGFLGALERRQAKGEDLSRARGFLLALRDASMERGGRGVPRDGADRLAELGGLNPERERERLAEQRARKWMWELVGPMSSERRDAISKLASMAAAAEPEARRAVSVVATDRLSKVLAKEDLPGEERAEAAVVLGLIGSEEGVGALRVLANDVAQPSELRRAALVALGLAAKSMCGERGIVLRAQIEDFLEEHLRADALDLFVEGAEGWAEHDRRLPLLQGASRGLQLSASADLPLLGSGLRRAVPMLTLTALKEGKGLRIRTEVVTPKVWRLPLPDGEQMELVVISGGEHRIGSKEDEIGRDFYTANRDGCIRVNVEAERSVKLSPFAITRQAITQAQWRKVAQLPRQECDLTLNPGTYRPNDLWERHAQVGALPVDSVSWNDCQEWLRRFNAWLEKQWPEWSRTWPHLAADRSPRLVLPGEGQWEAACRAGLESPFHFGDVLDASWANFDGGYNYGVGRKGDYQQRPVPVGFFGLVNYWGLAEMHGQMLEWCGDLWHPNPIGAGWPSDGQPWEEVDPDLEIQGTVLKDWRQLRGGSWFSEPRNCRAAIRYSYRPARISPSFGFRPCCLLPPGLLLGS